MDLGKFLPVFTEATLRKMAYAVGVVTVGAAGYWIYRGLQRKTEPLTEHIQPATQDEEQGLVEAEEDVQVDMSNWQLVVPDQPDQLPEEEPVILLSGKGKLNSTSSFIQFLYTESHHSPRKRVQLKMCYICVVEGSRIQRWWFYINNNHRFNHMEFPFYTCQEDSFCTILTVSGKVREFLSCRRMETFVNVQLVNRVKTTKEVLLEYRRLWSDGHEEADRWLDESTFCVPSDIDSDSDEGSEDDFLEEFGLPVVSCHLQDCGISDVAVKLAALRDSFYSIMRNSYLQRILVTNGKELAFRIAALNKQDVVEVQRSFDAMIQFLMEPANQDSIKLEMADHQLHLNLLDVLYELVLFGWFNSDSSLEFMEGGFLNHLFRHLYSWHTEVWEPAAEECFSVLQDQLMEFLKEIFSQRLDLYGQPGRLDCAVLTLIKKYIPQMLETVRSY